MRKLIIALTTYSLFLIPGLLHANVISGFMNLADMSGTTYQATVTVYMIGPAPDSVSMSWGDTGPEWIYRSNSSNDTVCDSLTVGIYTAMHTYFGPGTYKAWANLVNYVANIVNNWRGCLDRDSGL